MNTDEAVIVALGGNLALDGRPVQAVLEDALQSLEAEGLGLTGRSRWWRSAAWPDPAQPPFLNGVTLVETRLSPREVLQVLMRVEAKFGRRRSEPNGPRTLDLDLIAYGRQVVDEPDLILPHPRAADRRFVMGPLADVAPGWRHPILGETAAELAAKATVGTDAPADLKRTAVLENEMDASRKEDEGRALAFAALALVKALITALEKKGLLEGDEIQGLFDGALTSLELRVQEPAVGLARRIIEGIAITRTAQGPEDDPPSQNSN